MAETQTEATPLPAPVTMKHTRKCRFIIILDIAIKLGILAMLIIIAVLDLKHNDYYY